MSKTSKNMTPHHLVVALLVIGVHDLRCQTPERLAAATSWSVARTVGATALEKSSVSVRSGGEVTWRIDGFATGVGSTAPATAQLPFYAVGFRGVCATAASDSFLVGGVDLAGSGKLVLAELVGDAWSYRSIAFSPSSDIGVIDPSTVCWSPQESMLYVFDYNTGAIFGAPWNGLAPLPGAGWFFQIAPGAALSEDILSANVEPYHAGGILIYPPEPLIGEPTWLRLSGGAWVWSVMTQSPAAPTLEVRCLDYVSPDYDAFVRSSGTGPFSIVNLDGSVVFSGAIAVANSWVTIPAGTLDLNTSYRTSFHGVLSDVIIRPVIRHALPSASVSTPEVEVGRAAISWDGPVYGEEFTVTGWVAAPVASGTVDVVIALGLGLNDPGTPTTQVGSMTLMSNLIWIAGPWLYSLTPSAPVARFSFSQSVGSASGLALAMQPVYQWAATTQSGAIVLSDVVGSEVY